MSNKIIIPSVLLILAIVAGYWVTLPKNYDDCVLKHIDEAQTDSAAIIIRTSCRNKFPKPKSDAEAFFEEKLRELDR